MTATLVDRTTGDVLAQRVRRARGAVTRTIGLASRRSIAPDEGMWFAGCRAIHTFGMRCPIDVLFLDGQGRVARTLAGVGPGRVLRAPRGARDVLEMGAGFLAASGIGPGAQLGLREGG